MGVVDLQSRQGAVAGRRRRRAGHQARPRPLLRGGRRLDDAAHQGPALLDRPRARRHRRRAVLPAPRHAGHLEPARAGQGLRRPQALPADRPGRGPGRRGADRRRSSCIPGTASPASRRCRAGWSSISIPRPDVDVRRGDRGRAEMRERLEELGLVTLLQDHRRQGPACRDAAASGAQGQRGLDGGQGVRARRLRAMAADEPERYLVNMAKKQARRADLPRLSAQRPHVDGGRAAVAARAAGRDGLDAADLGAGEGRVSIRSASRSAPCRRCSRRRKAWEGYDDAASSIKAAMKKLGKK